MKKNKRKIKVPAAAYGLGQATTAEMAGLSGLYNSNSIASGQLPTPSMPNVAVQPKAPAMGGGFGGAMQMLPDAIDLVSNPFKKSTATSGKDAAMQSVANVGKGAAMGAMVGGPVGAIVGAGIGAIGSGGEKASMDNFIAYNEGTLGTGLIGAFGNKGLRKERDRIKTNAYNNRAAVQGTNDLENRYDLEHGDMQVYSAAVGGEVPSSLAYVDDGELIQTPDGSVSKVPEMGQPLDSNLVNLPEGSRILSNTLKVPGTKKTFSQLGDEMMTKKISKGKDKFAENSNKLNAMNNKAIHDQLFEIQEQVKLTRGIKNKNKSVESFSRGGRKVIQLEDIGLADISDPVINDYYDLPTTPQDIKPGFVPIKRTGEVPTPPERTWQNMASEALSDISALAPAMSNMLAGRAETVDAVQNPYTNAINRTMRSRRFNVSPAIQDVNRNRAVSNYNMSQMNTNTGANLAYRLQGATNMDRAIADLRSQESNINNQYAGEYANTMNALGQQYVNATNISNEANAQNRAAARNIRRTGMSQASQWVQNRQQMRNQRNRDNAMMQLYAPFLKAGFTASDMAQFNRWLKQGGNSYVS